ncbi:hypothetical protein ACFDAA_19255 [Enterococcus casseliflavus]|uniref:hypothetical protein n=1 Tax=Enterococcus casseliflavus TaxID=37734 RepID=UPI0039A6C071
MIKTVLSVFLSVLSLCFSIHAGAAEIGVDVTRTDTELPNQETIGPKGHSVNNIPASDVPINIPKLLSSVNTTNEVHSMLYLNQTKYAGWIYPTMQSQREPWYDQIVFEESPRGVYLRVLESKADDEYVYFNISNRGYVYLDQKANAREFSVTKLPPSDTFFYDTYRLLDLQTGEPLGIYNGYITIGSGTIPQHWIFR